MILCLVFVRSAISRKQWNQFFCDPLWFLPYITSPAKTTRNTTFREFMQSWGMIELNWIARKNSTIFLKVRINLRGSIIVENLLNICRAGLNATWLHVCWEDAIIHTRLVLAFFVTFIKQQQKMEKPRWKQREICRL